MATNAPRYIRTTPRSQVPTPKGVRNKAASGRWGPRNASVRQYSYFQKMHRIDPAPSA